MSDISELETRITTALERISTGLSALTPQSGSADEEIEHLNNELEVERTTNKQLVERAKVVQQKRARAFDTLHKEVDQLRGRLAEEEAALAKMRRVNDELRANNNALREAVSAGVAEPHLINKSMMAELDSLRATQAADRVELNAVLGEIDGLIAENDPDAPEIVEKEGSDA